MDPHVSRSTMVRALTAEGAEAEADAAIPHLLSCRRCQEIAAGVVEELRERSALVPASKPWAALLTLLEEEERQNHDKLLTGGWWTELRELAPGRQRERVRSVLSLQTREVFEAAISHAARVALDDPHLGEELALTACAVAESLSCPPYSQELKSDLQGRGRIEVANCRRLAAGWSVSHRELQVAWRHLEHGTGDPKLKARLFSISASLASDTGNYEAAHRLLAQAAEQFRASDDATGLASISVQEASVLLAGGRFEEAMARAREALKELSPRDTRLEMFARDTITDCLIELKRPAQALCSFLANQPLYELLWGPRNQLRFDYKKARLLDAFNYARESEKAFRVVIDGALDEGLYKSAFLYTLAFFEGLVKRGALEKAARVCEDAAALLDTPFCHPQMKRVWEDLLAEVRSRAVTVGRILEVRLYTLRHWSVPAASLPSGQPQSEAAVAMSAPLPLAEAAVARSVEAEKRKKSLPPADLPDLANGGYWRSMDDHDRKLIVAALAQTKGNLTETARLVKLSRNGLKAKIGKLGLTALVAKERRPAAKKTGPRQRSSYGPPRPG
jgi:tetratricopeptide (TPR) repeat protein